MPEQRAQHVAVALSGGGHRAGLFGLGSLLYLVDAGKGPEIATVSSISGGSMTNGFVAAHCDLTRIGAADFRTKVKPLATAMATGGTVWASPLTYLYLASIAAALVGGIVAGVVLDGPAAWAAVVVGVVLAGWLAQQRSAVAVMAFDRVLFKKARLADANSAVDHVVCAADLQTAELVFFSPLWVYAYRGGWGSPGRLPLARAVQSSAALPGAFNNVTMPVAGFSFNGTPAFPQFRLSDGGVYDNMGTEWPIRLSQRLEEGVPSHCRAPHEADELIVVNGSAGRQTAKRASLRVPWVGELTTLLAVKDVLYDQTTAVRRRWLRLRFIIASRAGADPDGPLAGTLCQIDRSPYALPDSMAAIPDELGDRARAAIAALGGDANRAAWQAEADANKSVKTALSKIPVARAASLLRHSYVLTMVNCHVLLGYPLREVPDAAAFESLVR